ncbi:MAG: DEAD/DEAH box helicase [Candidatus Omnitrophica bacterium]|jgi:ATP-dependent RNA helicase RhlE|nr:DEAD/DEAH box helicase [Candidatus Omnitrophota bacterium]
MHNQQGYLFNGLGIVPKILETLYRMRFTTPTPIQYKAIPIAIEEKDLIGVAQTGTGKTLAFAIPVIQRLLQKRSRCLVLVPTRELALQVDAEFRKIGASLGIKTSVIIGGAPIQAQLNELRRDPRIIIATPGRLVDHINRRTAPLYDVGILVLDEADRMLDMGFLPDIERILRVMPKKRQTMLFSATIPKEILQIASSHMRLPVHIEVAPSGTTAEHVTQELFIVKKDAKNRLLAKLLAQYKGAVLIFSRTKIGAKKITRYIKTMGYTASEIHSDKSLGQRKEALSGFKTGKYRVLVATDIAARGIDVMGIELVINYDIPDDAENYVHRIGRTGRAGHEGHAISFATPEQSSAVRSIEKIIKTTLPVSGHPDFPKEVFINAGPASKPAGFSHKPAPKYFNKKKPRRFYDGRFAKKRNFHAPGKEQRA